MRNQLPRRVKGHAKRRCGSFLHESYRWADLASDLADLKALIHASSSEYFERTVDVMLSEGHYQRHLNRLRSRLGEATAMAVKRFKSVGAKIFARNDQSLYLWASLPNIPDSLAFAQALLPQKIVIAPGRILRLDSAEVSPWSSYNVGAVADPRFAKALLPVLRQFDVKS